MKKFNPFLGLYRSLFIVLIVIAVVYATFNFFQYQAAMREFVIDDRPSVQIERQYQSELQNYENYLNSTTPAEREAAEKAATSKDFYMEKPTYDSVRDQYFQFNDLNPTDDIDQIWLGNVFSRIIGGTITFIFAIITIVLALFALNNKRPAAIASPILLATIFISNQVTIFLANGLFGLYQYNQYFFNFLELIFIITFIGLLVFVITYKPKQPTQ